jgi:hypothetical protein
MKGVNSKSFIEKHNYKFKVTFSVAHLDPDSYVIGPPGSGSGSGSFYHQARKTLIPTVL